MAKCCSLATTGEPGSIIVSLGAIADLKPMNYRGRIAIDPEIRFGKPCVRGTRITVGDVLSYLASGMRQQQLLADFPQLTNEDILACLAFAAERERRVVSIPAG
jgi:uncharacterized protein (DUF433 family)